MSHGDRLAIFGRWILDQGHGIPKDDDPNSHYRTEIHPPLLMATGSVQQDAAGGQFTRVLFMSRPFLPAQKYTVDPKDAYNDNAEDDGPLASHLKNEIAKVIGVPFVGIPLSWMVEAHPKIKSFPFRGAHLLRVVIRPPVLPDSEALVPCQLALSFHFTIRGGCAVQVISTAKDSVDVLIALNEVGYTPFSLPERTERTYSRDQLDSLSRGAGGAIFDVEALASGIALLLGGPGDAAKVALILERGIKTSEYARVPEIDILDRGNAAANVFADQIPAGVGVTVNDNQPYPVYGWLEAKWIRPLTPGEIHTRPKAHP